MPATARMAIPLFLALIVWVTYNVVGFKHNGISYITGMLWPRNVPVGMRPLVGRHRVPVQHHPAAVLPGGPTLRQHARRAHAARHVRPADERACSSPRPSSSILKPMAILPFFMLLFLTAFEVLVGFLQAYIFTILTARVHRPRHAHPEH